MTKVKEAQYVVRSSRHMNNLDTAINRLLGKERFIDVTLACDGHKFHCHRLVLAACSPLFEELLIDNPTAHPTIILPGGIKSATLQSVIDFMYIGYTSVSQKKLKPLMECAELLQVAGLHYAETEFQEYFEVDVADDMDQEEEKEDDDQGCKEPEFEQVNTNEMDYQEESTEIEETAGEAVVQIQKPIQRIVDFIEIEDSQDVPTAANEEVVTPKETTNHDNIQTTANDNNTSSMTPDPKPKYITIINKHIRTPVQDVNLLQAPKPKLQVVATAPIPTSDPIEEIKLISLFKLAGRPGKNGQPSATDEDVPWTFIHIPQSTTNSQVPSISTKVSQVPSTSTKVSQVPSISTKVSQVPSISTKVSQVPSISTKVSQVPSISTKVSQVPSTSTKASQVPSTSTKASQVSSTKKHVSWAKEMPQLRTIPKPVNNDTPKPVHAADLGANPASTVSSFLKFNSSSMAISVKNLDRSKTQERVKVLNEAAQPEPEAAVVSEQAATAKTDVKTELDTSPETNFIELGETKLSEADFPRFYAMVKKEQADQAAQQAKDKLAAQLNPAETEAENIICQPNVSFICGGGDGGGGGGGGDGGGGGGGGRDDDDDDDETYGNDEEHIVHRQVIKPKRRPPPKKKPLQLKNPSRIPIRGKRSVHPPGLLPLSGLGSNNLHHSHSDNKGKIVFDKYNSIFDLSPPMQGKTTHSPQTVILRNPRSNQPRTYSTESLFNALMAVKYGESIYRASRMHEVPRKTLRNWMKRWDIKSQFPMPKQLEDAAKKKRQTQNT